MSRIVESLYRIYLNEDLLNEAKEDIEKFVNKFGQEAYDDFQRLKQRIKQVKDENGNPTSLDILYHYKNTSPKEMSEIISRAESREYEKGHESKIDIEGKIIPRPANTKKLLYNKNGYNVYFITDYTDMIDVGDDTGWCIAGRYEYYDEPKGVCKVSQAKQYFYEYMEECNLDGYYVVIEGNEKYCLLISNENVYSIWDESDDEVEYSLKELFPQIPLEVFGVKDWTKEVFIYDGTTKVPKDIVKVKVADGVTKISDYAFYGCTSLTSISIPDSVTKIMRGAFYGCTSLTSISIPKHFTDEYIAGWDLPETTEIIRLDKIHKISDRYNTSSPVSGSWNTEIEHQQKAISDELGVSMSQAKQLMIDELGFENSMFNESRK